MDWGVSLFPCFDEIVAGVPDLGRYQTVATRDRYRPARPCPVEPRTAR